METPKDCGLGIGSGPSPGHHSGAASPGLAASPKLVEGPRGLSPPSPLPSAFCGLSAPKPRRLAPSPSSSRTKRHFFCVCGLAAAQTLARMRHKAAGLHAACRWPPVFWETICKTIPARLTLIFIYYSAGVNGVISMG